MSFQIALCLPRDVSTVSVVRSVATAVLDRMGVEEHCVDDIRLILSEACTNVVEHAQASDEYEVRLEVNESRCVVSVKDAGHGVDVAHLPNGLPAVAAVKGRGLAIIAALSDDMSFVSEPHSGTVVRFVKDLVHHDVRAS